MHCAVKACDKTARRSSTMCSAHLERVRLYGDPREHVPLRVKAPSRLTPERAFSLRMPGRPPSEDSCWEWTGTRNSAGYGVIDCTNKNGRDRLRAHRVAYTMFVGDISDDLVVRHRCDNPPCCNPSHLLLGTKADNSADMVQRQRQGERPAPKGQAHYRAVLTDEDVVLIRELGEQGWTQQALADRFGVCQTSVWRILRRKTWRHI